MRPTGHQASAMNTAELQTIIRSWARASEFRLFPGEFKSHFAVAIGIFTPILAHLDEQEEMNGLANDIGQLLARFRANCLDRCTALAEHDLPLAFALDENRLLDADRFVLALGPAIGLNSGLIR